MISEVSYDSDHLITVAIRHQDTSKGITKGTPIDRLTLSSYIKNGLFYITIYSGKNSWKKGHRIQTFSIEGNPYLRIDGNKVKLDYLGDLPETLIIKSEFIRELESQPEPITEEEEATPEQLIQFDDLQKQIAELEDILSTKLNPSSDDLIIEQSSKVGKLEKETEKPETANIEHKIIQTLQKQNKKLDNIEKKLHGSSVTEKNSLEFNLLEAYCVKCKTKRKIDNHKETTMKNGRAAIKGTCSVCNCKVFRIGKMKK